MVVVSGSGLIEPVLDRVMVVTNVVGRRNKGSVVGWM